LFPRGNIAVQQVFGPTEDAGLIQIGDIIRSVNDTDIFGLPFDKIMGIMKGVQLNEV
jgi:hypothetical protein